MPVLNNVFAFEPEHRVAVAMAHIVSALRVLRVADPKLLLNYAGALNDALRGIDDLVAQTAEISRSTRPGTADDPAAAVENS